MTASTGADEDIRLDREGVTVTKSLVTDEFPVPTVRFTIDSGADAERTVRVTDRIPDSFSMDAIGFHPDYHSDKWTAYQDHRIEFETDVDPGESVETIYGIRSDDDLEAFMGEPEVSVGGEESEAEVDDDEEDEGVEEIVDPDRGDNLREMIAQQSTAATDEADIEPEREPAEATESTEPAETDDEPEPADEPEPEPSEPAPVMPDSIGAALAEELRAGKLDEEDKEVIQEELGLELSESAEAQLRHLQTRVEDVLAYANPLAELLDDGGAEIIEEVEELSAAAETHAAELDKLRADISQAQDELSDIRPDVHAHGNQIDAIESQLETLEDDLEGLEGDLTGAADRLEANIDGVDADIDDLEADIEDIEDDIEEIRRWRDQLGELFGGSE